jgi:DNA-binding NarL/FixJ family response regulator
MNMPKMNGHACLTKIKEELQLLHIPVIILSTTDQPAIMNKAYEAGALKYYQKPISLTAFKKIVKEILATPIEH